MNHDVEERPDGETQESTDGADEHGHERTLGARFRPTGRSSLGLETAAGAACVLIAVGLSTAFVPGLHSPFVDAKAAMVIVAAGVGAPFLLVLLRSSLRWQATLGLAFVAAAALSALFSENRAMAVFGTFEWPTGLLFIVALVGCWAIGASTRGSERRIVERALVGGGVVNALVVIVGNYIDLSGLGLAPPGERSQALLGNPVNVAALLTAVVALCAWHGLRREWWWLVPLAVCVTATVLTGSRIALVVYLAIVVLAVFTTRVRAVPIMATMAVGLAFGVLVAAYSGTVTGLIRFSYDVDLQRSGAPITANTGYGPRLDAWTASRHSIARRPLTGVGPSQFRDAVTRYRSYDQVKGPNHDRYFTDAHNIVVEYATTTGLLGLGTLILFLGAVTRRARGAPAWFAGALFISHLVQPQTPITTPLLFLALGVACAGREPPPSARPVRWVGVASTVAATAFAISQMIGSWHLDQGVLDVDLERLRSADRLLPYWAKPADEVADAYNWLVRVTKDDDLLPEAVRARRAAVARDPRAPRQWIELANERFVDRALNESEQAARRALDLDPNSALAALALGKVEGARGNWSEAVQWLRRSYDLSGDGIAAGLIRIAHARAAAEGRPLPGHADDLRPGQ